MVDCLLDTAILIDLIRQYPPALDWISTQDQAGVSGLIWLELLQGAHNKVDQQKATALLNKFERVAIQDADIQWAIEALLRYHLSHQVSPFDTLIASVSYRLQIPLYTRNLKHFTIMLGSLAQSPY